MNELLTLALLVGLGPILAALVMLILEAQRARKDVAELHAIVNSRLSELVVAVGQVARLEGRVEGIASERQRVSDEKREGD